MENPWFLSTMNNEKLFSIAFLSLHYSFVFLISLYWFIMLFYLILIRSLVSQVIRANETQVLVAILSKDLTLAAEIVSELWNAKIKAEFGLTKRVMNHITRAKQSGIPWMVLVGESEVSTGIYKLKNIEANQEEDIPKERIVEELRIRLGIAWQDQKY